MRAYFFQNFYLQGIHAGIQSQHTTAEMFVKYQHKSFQKEILFDWATNHKTTIVLNGGMQKDLLDIIGILNNNIYPFAWFKEEQDALNMALTNVGVILTPLIYEAPSTYSEHFEDYAIGNNLADWQVALITTLQSKRLMN